MREHSGRISGFIALLLFASLLVAGGCKDVTDVSASVGEVRVTPQTISIEEGQNHTLVATVLDAQGRSLTGRSISWVSEDPSVATVEEGGRITGVAPGSTIISASCEGVIGRVSVTVLQLPVASVEVSPTSGNLLVGATLNLDALLSAWHGGALSGRDVLWSSSNPDVAAVTTEGVVMGVAEGAAMITASSEGKEGSSEIRVVPEQEVGAFSSTISAGWGLTCGVTQAGEVYCWGLGMVARLGQGDGDFNNANVPLAVPFPEEMVSVSAGLYHACALSAQGNVYCWGDGLEKVSGVPVKVSGGLTFSSINVGYYHSCGVTTSGAAYCWGWGGGGELGTGSTDEALIPTEVLGGLSFSSVTAGLFHSCGVTIDGVGYCWGEGEDGQLGDGERNDRLTPTQVAGGLIFSSISAGVYNTCGVTEDGVGYCWRD